MRASRCATMPLPRSVLLLPFLAVVLLSTSAPPQPCRAAAHGNITDILLSGRGDLAEFARALAASGLADRIINSRGDAVTVLAVADAHMAPLGASASGGLPREALRRELSRHVLAGYYDDASLRRLLLLPGVVGAGAADIVAPTLEDAPAGSAATAGAVRIARERRSGRVAFAPLHDARATVFYVGPVLDAPGGVSVLLVSGVMWNPADAPPAPKLKPSSAPAPAGQGRSRAGERAAEVLGHQVTPHHVSATQQRVVVSSSTAPAPAPPENRGVRGRQKINGWFIFDIIVVFLFIVGFICCCRCGN